MKKIYTRSTRGKEKVLIPEYWGEVTTRQYQKMHSDWDANDLVKLFSILTGIEYKTLFEKRDTELEYALIEATRFIYDTEPAFKKAKPPPFITIHKRKVRIPKKLGQLSIGQNIIIRQRMDGAKTFEELISIACAVYLQPFYDTEAVGVTKKIGKHFEKTVEIQDGKFNYEKALALEEKILELPISETYPIGFFLLRPQMSYGRNIIKRLRRTITLLWRRYTTKGSLSVS